ncbi:hypothetical protein [Parafrankia sp. CH37]|nr:hypothetical protein [Parafrankia sp. CH37]
MRAGGQASPLDLHYRLSASCFLVVLDDFIDLGLVKCQHSHRAAPLRT